MFFVPGLMIGLSEAAPTPNPAPRGGKLFLVRFPPFPLGTGRGMGLLPRLTQQLPPAKWHFITVVSITTRQWENSHSQWGLIENG